MKFFIWVAVFVLMSAGIAAAGTSVNHLGAVEVPTMMPWGMVGTAAAMGLSGLYFIFKRK